MTTEHRADVVGELGPMGPPPWPSRDGRAMVKVAGDAIVHRVGAPSWTGARAAACGLRGGFMEPPDEARLPRCPDCWGSR